MNNIREKNVGKNHGKNTERKNTTQQVFFSHLSRLYSWRYEWTTAVAAREKKKHKQKYLENNGENFCQRHRFGCARLMNECYLEWDDQIDSSQRNYVQFTKLCIWISEQRMGINSVLGMGLIESSDLFRSMALTVIKIHWNITTEIDAWERDVCKMQRSEVQ